MPNISSYNSLYQVSGQSYPYFAGKDTKNIDMLNVISKISTIKVQLFRVFYLYSNEKPSMMPFESM